MPGIPKFPAQGRDTEEMDEKLWGGGVEEEPKGS